MNCESVQEKLIAEDPLGFDEESRAHLQQCAECRAFQDDYSRIHEGMDELEASAGPSELTAARILNAAKCQQDLIKQKARRSFWHVALSRPVQVAAMFVFVVGVGLYTRDWLLRERPEADFSPRMTEPAPAPVDAPEKQTAPTKPQSDFQLEQDAQPVKIVPGQGPAETSAPAPPPKIKAKEIQRSPQAPRPEETAPQDADAAPPQPAREAPPAAGIGASGQPDSPEPRESDKAKTNASPLGGVVEKRDAAQAKPAAPVAAPAKSLIAPAANQTEQELKRPASDSEKASGAGELRQKDTAETNGYQSHLQAARGKISRKDWNGALEDLIAAQQIDDTKEIRDLIVMVRSHLRGDE